MSGIIEQLKKHSILVVDDSPDIIVMLSTILKDLYKTKIATSGEKALKLLESQDKPDLILLDIVMPGMNGYEVLKQIKSNPDTWNIPVIFLTSQTGVQEEKKGLN